MGQITILSNYSESEFVLLGLLVKKVREGNKIGIIAYKYTPTYIINEIFNFSENLEIEEIINKVDIHVPNSNEFIY